MDPKPFKEKPQNIPNGLLDEVKEHLDHMLEVGAIKPSKSAWSNAVVLVQEKDKGLRFCIDFCPLNSQTQKDAFSLPQIQYAINALSGCKHYTTVDFLSGFLADVYGGILKAVHCFHHGHAGILAV